MARKRDYKREYQRRLERGAKFGKSRSAARGHARAEDLGPLPPGPMDRDSPFERALKDMKRGASLRRAATSYGLRPEPLRRFVKRATTAKLIRGRWTIFDLRTHQFRIASKGAYRTVVMAIDDASDVGRYWVAVNRFLDTNDPSHLAPFVGKGVRDAKGKFHPFETGPNVLRKLDSIGALHFLDIYADGGDAGGDHG
jgi:hypothetical protein